MHSTNKFLDSLSSHMFSPHIIQSTRVPSSSKTLIDDIFSNILGPDSVSENLIATISDHLLQFVIASNIFSNSLLGRKSNIYERDWIDIDQENFILDYLAEDWNSIIKKEEASINLSFQSFLSKINFISDKYAPLKKISKHMLKFKSKPWIRYGIQRSISVKNKLLSKFIKLRDVDLKNEAHFKYKQYRNLLSTLLKRSKQSYLTNTSISVFKIV